MTEQKYKKIVKYNSKLIRNIREFILWMIVAIFFIISFIPDETVRFKRVGSTLIILGVCGVMYLIVAVGNYFQDRKVYYIKEKEK